MLPLEYPFRICGTSGCDPMLPVAIAKQIFVHVTDRQELT
jgi:hypothetical protein